MVIKTIDAKMLQKMFLMGAKSIEANKEYINKLNVFPVPDGDTGTNMSSTIISAAKEVAKLTEPTFETLAKTISTATLRGARGNSGVILSQLCRGFSKELMGAHKVDAELIARSFETATKTAYSAVMKPKEGTILTVARGGADEALEAVYDDGVEDIVELLDRVVKNMQKVLDYTPNLLPVLKQANVVDSGGQGLLEIIRGAYYALIGKELDVQVPNLDIINVTVKTGNAEYIDISDIKFGYCTEFIILLEKEYNENIEIQFKKFLTDIGDSVVVVSDDGIVKVHVHTNHPGEAIEKALTYGSLTSMKIDNMREEHQEKVIKDAKDQKKAFDENQPKKEFGFISVSIGEGLNKIFKDLHVDYVIEGGQTMNPSTEDMLTAIENVHADNIFIFPNNSNIILTANQAKDLVEDKNIIVIPTKSVPQGIAAILNFAEYKTIEENESSLIEAIKLIKTGQVTYAVRDTNIDGKDIKMDDIMGMGDGKMLAVGQDIMETTKELIDQLVDESSEIITIYYGEEIEESVATDLGDYIDEKYEDCEVEVYFGGQPIYYYLISVE